ncbi:hypothetical protein PHMEG_00028387 [Phytophthora megakarya]|uniref:Uncharacterized protein n=1 Tax=Phytophthora megakarya TaxID=4795 RepID=A0A225V532_9STRA|nr:hypothetical protein PHMEG_00028387 [Phytophthora megakarya]
MPVLEAVKEQHPSLGLGVSTFGTGNIFSRIAYISLKWCPTNDFDRQIFHNCPEGPGDREIYRDASMYEEISGDERDDEEMDEGEQIAAQDMLLWRAMMTRFMLEEEILSEEFQ